MAVTLNQFISAAEIGGKIRFVDGDEGKGLHATGSRWKFWMVSSRKTLRGLTEGEVRRRNKATVDTFISLIQNKYGPSGGALADTRLRKRITGDYPLRGRDVKWVMKHAARTHPYAEANLQTAEEMWKDVARKIELPDRDREITGRCVIDDLVQTVGEYGIMRLDRGYLMKLKNRGTRISAIQQYNRRIARTFAEPAGALLNDIVVAESGRFLDRPVSPDEINLEDLGEDVKDAISALRTPIDPNLTPISIEEARGVAVVGAAHFLENVRRIDAAHRDGLINDEEREMLRNTALMHNRKSSLTWHAVDQLMDVDWRTRARVADTILRTVQPDAGAKRMLSHSEKVAEMMIANAWRDLPKEQEISLDDVWLAVFGEEMPRDLGPELFAERMYQTAKSKYEKVLQLFGERKGILETAILEGLPFQTILQNYGRGIELDDLAALRSLAITPFDWRLVPDNITRDICRWGTGCRMEIMFPRQGSVVIEPNTRLDAMMQESDDSTNPIERRERERNAIEIIARDLTEAISSVASTEQQALTACFFFTQRSCVSLRLIPRAIGMISSEHSPSQFVLYRDPNASIENPDLIVRIRTGEDSSVDYVLEARIDARGAYRVTDFRLMNLRQRMDSLRKALSEELDNLTDARTMLREESAAGEGFRNLFRGLGRDYLEGLGRWVSDSVMPLMNRLPDMGDTIAVKEFRAELAAAVIRVIAGSIDRMPLEIRKILVDARDLCMRYDDRFPNIWRSVIENMVIFRGVIPMVMVPIVEGLKGTDPLKAAHLAQAAQFVETCLAGRFPEGEGLGALEAVRNEAGRFLDDVSHV